MNKLTSKQRKLIYVGGIGLLLIPIIYLGMPGGGDGERSGVLSALNREHDLGEGTLGNVDPSSAAANLVLLGMRGPAASLLRLEAEHLQETKNWGKMRAIVDTITLLQPHFLEVWKFQGWNLAYNVSSAWDATEDRYYWVKEGIKFQKQGILRNKKSADLVYHTARLIGWKIGQADEWKQFRRFFMRDPDTERFNGPDPELNPNLQDHWLVAKQHYYQANNLEEDFKQTTQARELFRMSPARAQIEYAATLLKEGLFDSTTMTAWENAYRDWSGNDNPPIQGFGAETFKKKDSKTGREYYFTLDEYFPRVDGDKRGDTAQMRRAGASNFPEDEPNIQLRKQNSLLEMPHEITNYRYWRQLTVTEKQQTMLDAHKHIYRGKEFFRQGRTSPRGKNRDQPSEAQAELEAGMQKLAEVFKAHPDLEDDSLVEEAMMAIQYWRYIHEINGQKPTDDFDLKKLWDKNRQLLPEIERKFRRERNLR